MTTSYWVRVSNSCGAVNSGTATVTVSAPTPPPPSCPAGRLCLRGGRFQVSLFARDQRTGKTANGTAIPENDLFGLFALPELTGTTANPEVFVKVLDGRPVNGRYWVFYGGLTDLEYTVTVRDTVTGATKTYGKAAGSYCGGADTAAFTLANAQLVELSIDEGLSFEAEALRPVEQLACSSSTLCLLNNRFDVSLAARDHRTGKTGAGVPLPKNNLFGYFTIPALTGDTRNPEVFVKVLDGRPVNGRIWVFYGGLTNLEYTLTVHDNTTGATKTYRKAGGSYCGGADTGAF